MDILFKAFKKKSAILKNFASAYGAILCCQALDNFLNLTLFSQSWL
ncbi:MAG TPA: hypothetical protein DHV15_02040 [Treponema sp.]|uniref:Uncharacterized protein n=1 Tax=Treponema denticola (strain ATCC 35405 / DSM 14222 / CIP 103919 / JCM 8153 / KCTC 15104) TaxID=243275 RepID=Q73K08_TREDE|nr:hypothetical protein TDE_2557 [Treponema denticola ATCC 35405]UTY26739.1 hypothetical protein E4N77_08755 [Treponema denticola]HCY94282.1 hypothetical protein [Treponema sp.]